MEGIHVNDSKQLQQVTNGLLHTVGARKNYSLAPCHHLFVSPVHLSVMVRWLILLAAYRMPREGTEYELHLVCLPFTSVPSPLQWLAVKVGIVVATVPDRVSEVI